VQKLAPTLRFPEFESSWVEDSIENLVLSYKLGGNYQNSNEENQYPLIKMGNVGRGYFVTNKLEYITGETPSFDDEILEGDLFFNTRNTLDLVGKVAVWRGELPKAYYNSNLLRLKFKNNYFYNYVFNSYWGLKKLKRIASGTTSVAAIYTKDLMRLKVAVPQNSLEQRKIADFITLVDKKLSLLKEKYTLLAQYKKGVMQKLLKQETRFKDESGSNFSDWITKRVDYFVERYSEPVEVESNKSYRQIGIRSHGKGIFHKEHVQGHELGGKRVFWVHPDAFVVNIVFAWEHAVAKTSKDEQGFIASHRFPMYLPKNDRVDLRFLTLFFLSKRGKHLLELASPGGAGRNKTLGQSNFFELKVTFPCLEEQKGIADFNDALEEKLEAAKKQIELTQTFKKGLLQQMFV
jgi:type I restriction enzyme S subunit